MHVLFLVASKKKDMGIEEALLNNNLFAHSLYLRQATQKCKNAQGRWTSKDIPQPGVISNYSRTSIIWTSIIWISRLSGLFLWSQFGYDYSLVTIKIRSDILFKTTALKGAVKCKGFLLSKGRGSARACRKVGLN